MTEGREDKTYPDAAGSVAVVALEDHRAVVAAQPDVVAHRVANLHLPSLTVDDVEVDLWVLFAVVRGRRRRLVVDAQHREDAFNGTGRAHQVASQRLGRRDR